MTTIHCDQVPDGWSYETCVRCRHFSCTVSPKGHQWRCKLNSKTAAEKRAFRMIVSIAFLNANGISFPPEEIAIDYVGKKKKNQ
jgi:hypothetical protein